MSASLNDIYKSIGELTSTVKALAQRIDENEQRNVAAIAQANESRANVHRRLDDLVLRTTNLEADAHATKVKVEEIQAITDGVESMTQRALGAGTLGRWLIKLGGWVISGAAGFAAAYTWLTGRPPP